MKTSRRVPELSNRSSIYGMQAMQAMQAMPQSGVETSAGNVLNGGVLKRLASAISRSERSIASAGRRTLKTVATPLVSLASCAAGSELAKFQAAVARAVSGKSDSPKGAGAMAQQVPPPRLQPVSAAQIEAHHHIAIADIKKLVTEFSADPSDVPTAVGKINEFSKSLPPSGMDLAGVTSDQVASFLEKAQSCDATPQAPKARDFLLRVQAKAPEILETGPYVTYPESYSGALACRFGSGQ